MTLHLFKHPVTPLAIQVLDSKTPEERAVAVLLPPQGDLPHLPGVTVYRMTNSSSPGDGQGVSYLQLIEMIFAADKVVAW